MLDSLQGIDPGGYKHLVKLHEGRPHWMNREDTVSLAWMAPFRRNAVPDKIVWKQDDVHHLSFYWLAVPKEAAQTGGEIIASYRGNEVLIKQSYTDTLLIHLNDQMMDLDKPVVVKYRGKEIFRGKVKRNAATIYRTVQERIDPDLVFSVELAMINGKVSQVVK